MVQQLSCFLNYSGIFPTFSLFIICNFRFVSLFIIFQIHGVFFCVPPIASLLTPSPPPLLGFSQSVLATTPHPLHYVLLHRRSFGCDLPIQSMEDSSAPNAQRSCVCVRLARYGKFYCFGRLVPRWGWGKVLAGMYAPI